MLKKTIIAIAAVFLLVGAENVISQERTGPPDRKGKIQKVQKERTPSRAKRGPNAGPRKATAKAKGQGRPGSRSFDAWAKQLTKAYKEKDMEKMGRLIRQMNQFKKQMGKRVDAPGRRFRAKAGPQKPRRKFRRRRPDRDEKIDRGGRCRCERCRKTRQARPHCPRKGNHRSFKGRQQRFCCGRDYDNPPARERRMRGRGRREGRGIRSRRGRGLGWHDFDSDDSGHDKDFDCSGPRNNARGRRGRQAKPDNRPHEGRGIRSRRGRGLGWHDFDSDDSGHDKDFDWDE